MTKPLTKEQIELDKSNQRAIIVDADRQIVNHQYNIGVLNGYIAAQTAIKARAQAVLSDLQDDYPIAAGTTTANGATSAKTAIDSGLIGTALQLSGKNLIIFPDDVDKREKKVITEFETVTGTMSVTPDKFSKWVMSGTPYQIQNQIPAL